MRKYMKNIPDATEDILDMQAGLLARRLTSLAKSNPEIKATLQAMDKATAVKGKTKVSIENLQDFYNVLDKYYDIAAKTGYQGQTTTAIEKASGVKDFIAQTVSGIAGKTDAVKRKAIEDALMEALK
jgi:exopolysaccharide biosynthesis predicted pyruvyltransferase EpsI